MEICLNGAAMNVHGQGFEYLFSVHLGMELGVELVGHRIILLLTS